VAYRQRTTAVLRLDLPGHAHDETLALDVEREYRFSLEIDGRSHGGGWFRSPLGDEGWSKSARALRLATEGSLERRSYNEILATGSELFKAITELGPELHAFLKSDSGPRRLVIASDRPEIHQLPWEAMVDFEQGRRMLAEGDVSLVRHALEGFDPNPEAADDQLKIFALAGPDTPGNSLNALKSAPDRRLCERLHSLPLRPDSENELSAQRFDELSASIVTIEAHGDPRTSEFSAATGWAAGPETLSQRVGKRLMVLLWSCFSGKIQSWGASPALHFHRHGTNFVLAFTTPLRHASAAEIAESFYTQVFRPREAFDPETAIVGERQRLYRNDPRGCDWVSMTLWLHRPVDLSPATQFGPRLPPEAWCSSEQKSKTPSELAQVLQQVMPGHAVRLEATHFSTPIATDLVDRFRGAVVQLSGHRPVSHLSAQKSDGVHPGDGFLALMDALASYERSLLIWSEIDDRELRLVEQFVRPPKNVAVVLVTQDNQRGNSQKQKASLPERLHELVESGQYEAAARDWERLSGQVEAWSDFEQVRYHQAGYWALIRLRRQEKALQCIDKLKSLAPFEAELLHANLEQRSGYNDRARRAYQQAQQRAVNDGNPRDLGRVGLELGYLAYELGDHAQAERLYLESIGHLERAKVDPERMDPLWASALGRGLRNYAQLLTEDPDRVDEAEPLLRRALAIHTMDGRWSQVAAALRTRGWLAMSRERWDEAEADFHAAAGVLFNSGNWVGWIEAVTELATLAGRRGHIEQALAILKAAYSQIEGNEAHKIQRGIVALQTAQLFWVCGRIEDVVPWCRKALKGLAGARPRELAKAQALLSTVESLLDKDT